MFRPKPSISTAPKKIMYVPLPFMNDSLLVQQELNFVLNKLYPYVDFYFVFKNSLTIGSLFHLKDILPELMRVPVVCLFSCPNRNFGTYVECTNRMLRVRIDSRRGVSHRTGSILKVKEYSAIRSDSTNCKHSIQSKTLRSFRMLQITILSYFQNPYSLSNTLQH